MCAIYVRLTTKPKPPRERDSAGTRERGVILHVSTRIIYVCAACLLHAGIVGEMEG